MKLHEYWLGLHPLDWEFCFIAAELFPGTDPSKLSFAEMVDFLKLKRFGSLVDDGMDQQVFILDLSFNPEITDELLVIYFGLNKEIFCITHES